MVQVRNDKALIRGVKWETVDVCDDGMCGSQRGSNMTLRFVSVSPYSGHGACVTTCDYMWAPLGDGSNVIEHKSHKVQALNFWLPLRESRLGRGRSPSPTDASLTS